MYKRKHVFAAACLGMLMFGMALITLGAVQPFFEREVPARRERFRHIILYHACWHPSGLPVIRPGMRQVWLQNGAGTFRTAILCGHRGHRFRVVDTAAKVLHIPVRARWWSYQRCYERRSVRHQ